MAVPPDGFTVAPLFESLRNYELPLSLDIHYTDSFRFGTVSSSTVLKAGYPEIVDVSGYRLIDITMKIKSVHDVVLLDRIE